MFNAETLESKGSFTIHPQGSFAAVCVCVIDLGTQTVKSAIYGEKEKRLVRIAFETTELITDEGDYKGKPYLAQQQFTVTSSENGLLRPFMESWRGKRYGSEGDAIAGLSNMDKMLGFPAMLNIVHSEDEKYANIASASPLPKGLEAPKPVMDTIIFSLDKPVWADYDKLTDNTKEKIAQSAEYKRLRPDPDAPTHAPVRDAAPADGPSIDFDDEVPF